MAAGLPEVVTNISGSSDAIESGTNGLVVERGQIDEMADALARLIENESLRRQFGRANLAKSRLYDWERISKMYLEHA
jgi:glycosyltransferase involved in cell wall biosynthesis